LRSLKDILALAAGAALTLFLLDATTFRTGFYTEILAPDSYAGRFRLVVRQLAETPRSATQCVLVLGNSVIAEGFSARVADVVAARRVRFLNASIPGSSLRSWYYLLRGADPQRDRYSVIVIPVEDYDDEDGVWDRDDYPEDLRIVIPALGIADILEFTGSHRKWDVRAATLGSGLLKGTVYRDDVRDFLRHPQTRLDAVDAQEEHGAEWVYGYEGHNGTVDRANPELQAMLHRAPAPQTGRHKRYRAYWLDRLMAPYRNRATRFLIIRTPRGPFPLPHYARFDPDSAVRALRARRNVVVEDERVFEFLEQPQYFFDALHLNASGRRLFSETLTKLLLTKFF
jgi:hypothetical protein